MLWCRKRSASSAAYARNALRLVAQGQIHRGCGTRLPREPLLDLLADRDAPIARFQKRLDNIPAIPEESEKQMVGLDPSTAELARLITRKEDDAPGLFGIPLEHASPRADLSSFEAPPRRPPTAVSRTPAAFPIRAEIRTKIGEGELLSRPWASESATGSR